MEFSRHLSNNLVAKNPLAVDSIHVYVECANVSPPVYFTASVDTLSTIAAHRWRSINGKVVTTRFDDSLNIEVPYSLGNILLHRQRFDRVHHRNKNRLDYTTSNLSLGERKHLTQFTVSGSVAEMTLTNKGVTVLIDAEAIPLVEPYTWTLVKTTQKVVATTIHNGKRTQLQLPRIILGLTAGDNSQVTYRTTNRLDCRKENLIIHRR